MEPSPDSFVKVGKRSQPVHRRHDSVVRRPWSYVLWRVNFT